MAFVGMFAPRVRRDDTIAFLLRTKGCSFGQIQLRLNFHLSNCPGGLYLKICRGTLQALALEWKAEKAERACGSELFPKISPLRSAV